MTTRRLAAILAADVVGFSSMMEKDEEGTLKRVKALQREVIEPKVKERGGRLVKTTGDGFLCEFGSPVKAVRCAVDIQGYTSANRSSDLLLRIGINLGDIIVEPDGDVFGDGVNVAARLEQLADPGGLCISGSVHEQAEGKVGVLFESRGEQQVKNITRPVRVYALLAAARSFTDAKPPPLPDKPSIAVLPFTNMSGDPEQEYFTDGITEEIITALTHVRWFFVIARNSSFVYRGRLPDVKQVGRELGVRYVLAGSLRRSGNRLRITGQLVEAETGCHLWADRYEGALEDVFELQDRIAESVVAAVEPKLLQVELTRARAKPTDNVGAYELYLRALWHFYPFTKQDNKTALGLLGQAISRDPDFALAHALSGHLHIQRTFQGWSEDRAADLEAGARLAQLALQKGGDDPRILWRAALALVHSGHDPTACVALSERAIELSPSSAEAVAMSGWLQVFAGGYEIAVQRFERAKRLSPVEPMLFSFNTGLGLAFMFLGRTRSRYSLGERSPNNEPALPSHTPVPCGGACALGKHSGGQECCSATPSN